MGVFMKRFFSTVFFSFFLFFSINSLSAQTELNLGADKNAYIKKYRDLMSSYSTGLSGDKNDNAIVVEAITASSNSGVVFFKNVFLFGALWDFSKSDFNDGKIVSTTLFKELPDNKVAKVFFEDVSNKIYKLFEQTPDKLGKECLDSYNKGGIRCYRVFSLDEKNIYLEMSISSNKIVVNISGDKNVKKK